MPPWITQCYLPSVSGQFPAFTPAEVGTRFSDPGWMQGWVDLGNRYIPRQFKREIRSADVQTWVIPRTYSSYGDRTSAAAGPRLWNSLPVQLRNSNITYGLFRRQLKGHLFGNKGRGALWLLISSALEKHSLIYLRTYFLTYLRNDWHHHAWELNPQRKVASPMS